MEHLEDRRVLATFPVSNLLDAPVNGPDSAPGTLRQAIYDANNTPGDDVVAFDTGLAGTVNLSVIGDTLVGDSALLITSTITIRGNTTGVTIGRIGAAVEMRLFRVAATGDLTIDMLSLAGGIANGVSGSSPGEGGGEGVGGAIYSQGSVRIIDSTLFNNMAFGGNAGPGGSGGSGFGGAIFNNGGELSVINSTLSGNSVISGVGATVPSSRGGAIAAENGSTSIYNSTITNNSASTGRGVYVHSIDGAATVAIQSSIIGQSDLSAQVREFLTAVDVNGDIIVTGGDNLIRSQGDFQFITVSTDDPLLEPLANNGGPAMTHALPENSPALNSGNNAQGLTFDQRGISYTRVAGGVADIGAYELQSAPGQALSGDYNGDHRVDGADFVAWRKTFGASVPKFSGADGDGSMFVDAGDYAVWRTGYGTTEAVAESVAAVMVVVGDPTIELDSNPIRHPEGGLATEGSASVVARFFAPLRFAQNDDIRLDGYTRPAPRRGEILSSSRTSDLALVAYLRGASFARRNSSTTTDGKPCLGGDAELQSHCEGGQVDAVWSAWQAALDNF